MVTARKACSAPLTFPRISSYATIALHSRPAKCEARDHDGTHAHRTRRQGRRGYGRRPDALDRAADRRGAGPGRLRRGAHRHRARSGAVSGRREGSRLARHRLGRRGGAGARPARAPGGQRRVGPRGGRPPARAGARHLRARRHHREQRGRGARRGPGAGHRPRHRPVADRHRHEPQRHLLHEPGVRAGHRRTGRGREHRQHLVGRPGRSWRPTRPRTRRPRPASTP